MTELRFTLCALLLGALAPACADDGTTSPTTGALEGGDRTRPPPGPPPAEAIAACEDAAEDDPCSFTLGGHTLDGRCRLGPEGQDPLACAPPLPPPLPPPPEALAACDGASAGDPCSFRIDGHDLDGQCRPGPEAGDPLACAPPLPPPPPAP